MTAPTPDLTATLTEALVSWFMGCLIDPDYRDPHAEAQGAARDLAPMGTGSYVSADDRFTAELRAAGYYADVGCKLTRHYAIRVRGSQQIIGIATTLAEAARIYGVEGCRR